jgi:tRNA-splicing ligase RtcB
MKPLDIILKNGKPVFSWCPNLEESARKQIEVVATLPFIEHMAVMPDAHMGMQMIIGGVVACDGIIVPNFVGVDGGCGVCALKTDITKEQMMDVELRKRIYHSVCRGVPMGFAHNDQRRERELSQTYSQNIKFIFEKTGVLDETFKPIQDVEKSFFSQLGSLGGGNHFIEVDYDEDGYIWLMLHSGSRNMGKRICDYFNERAEEKMKEWISINTQGIAFLPVSSDEGKSYIAWLDFALRFAHLNRTVMLEEMKKDVLHEFPNAKFGEQINIHHNYATQELHFGKNLWVHRKGAVCARKGIMGVIPGNMATGSYIVEGLGNPMSLNSSSHGAGRTEGRKTFNAKMNTVEGIEAIKKSMDGIVFSGFGKETNRKGKETGMLDVSEAPAAYKNLDEVMNNQTDLVKIVHKLSTLINWKDIGDE